MRLRGYVAGLALVGLLGGCGGSSPWRNGRIAIERSVQQGRMTYGILSEKRQVVTLSASGFNPIEVKSLFRDYEVKLPIWSPDGKHLLVVMGWTLYVVNADGSNPVAIAPFDEPSPEHKDFAWAGDGSRFAYVVNGVLHVVSADGRRRMVVADPGREGVYNIPLGWSKDGKRLVFYVHDRKGSKTLKLFTIAIEEKDFQEIAYEASKTTKLQQLGSDRLKFLAEWRWDIYQNCRMHENQLQVACLVQEGFRTHPTQANFQMRNDVVKLVSIDGGKISNFLPDKVHGLPVWSPDGRWVAFEADDGGDALWTLPANGWGERVKIVANPQAWDWSPDGRKLLVAPKTAVVDGFLKGQGVFLVAADGKGKKEAIVGFGKDGEEVRSVAWQGVKK